MDSIVLILPYFGTEFPDTFPILIDSLKQNPTIQFIIPTNIDYSRFEPVENIKFVAETLKNLNKKIDSILGYHAKLNTAYKLVDFKPMYGTLFSQYIESSDWWGYFDSDIIFGDIRSFLPSSLLNAYDKIFTHGHLTLFRNDPHVTNLWNHSFHISGVPEFKMVATHSAIFAFDEWGWGQRRGRGLSYAIHQSQLVKQFDDNELFADLNPDVFEFRSTTGLEIVYFIYDHGRLTGIDSSGATHSFLYVHFQKRSLINHVENFDHTIFIFPNKIDFNLNLESVSEEKNRWIQVHSSRKLRRFKSHLSFAYIFRRLLFLFSE